jgi:hypothetical protein
MKKILAVTLMLCIFTAMAVGTAAAAPSFVKVDSYQKQCAQAYGTCPTAVAAQAAGTLTIKDCKTKVVAIGGIQAAYASAYCGAASVSNTQCVSVITCA